MRKAFRGYYTPSQDEFKGLWEKCIFVLDTNVLLNVYRFPESARRDLLKVLKHISSRIWVPHQAALEFHENRLTVIAEQSKMFADVRAILEKTLGSLTGQLGSLNLRKRHSAIDASTFMESIQAQFANFIALLDAKEKGQPNLFARDTFLEEIDEILEGKTGEPFDALVLEQLYKEGAERYANKQPPGYLDFAKSKDPEPKRFANGTTIRREFGDLILWKQLLHHVKTSGISHVIFITDDVTEDWWRLIEARGTRNCGPRPELVDEFTRETSGLLLYMYNTERFLECSRQYLEIDVASSTIEQAHDIRQHRTNPPSRGGFDSEVLAAVGRWLAESEAAVISLANDLSHFNPIDLFAHGPAGSIAWIVTVLRGNPANCRAMVEAGFSRVAIAFGWASNEAHRFSIRLVFVLTENSPVWLDAANSIMNELPAAHRAIVTFGFLEQSNAPGEPPFRFSPIPGLANRLASASP